MSHAAQIGRLPGAGVPPAPRRYVPARGRAAALLGLVNIESVALFAYFFRDAFAGPVRYLLDIARLGPAWFLPDLVAFACIAVFVYRFVAKGSNTLAAVFVACIGFALVIGYFFLGTVAGVISSLKMIAPVFVGFLFADRYLGDYRKLLLAIYVLFVASMVGVVLSSMVDLPWIGYAFEGVGGTREATRVWWQGYEVRLPGFAADSTMAAFFIMITFVICSIPRSTLWALIWGPIAIYVCKMTTNKTCFAVLIVYFATFLLVRLFRREKAFRILRSLSVGSFACIGIPFVLMLLLSGIDLQSVDPLLWSMQDRINNSWQKPFVFMAELMPTGYVTGCGLGCFNYPQSLFSPTTLAYYVPVDNFYLGTYLMFGPIFAIFMAYVIQAMREVKDIYKLTIAFVINLYTITILSYGPASGLIMISFSFSSVFLSRAARQSIGDLTLRAIEAARSDGRSRLRPT
ncbi:hypothetical protein [Aureimonas sp. AU4]|uniref:hypothetical protein n=1 Tax=Aureimonas sp. AU4 TaxID=1638163 RepID=UPI00078274FE|nr:hypothetical protein [Aureimonas sp. AU4]